MTESLFTNAKVVGDRVKLTDYMGQSAKRGEPGFVMHSSALRAFLKNPQKWILVGEEEAQAQADAEEDGEHVVKASTKAQAWGSLVDCLLTMPDEFEHVYQMTPPTYEDSKGRTADWTWKSSTCRNWRDRKQLDGWQVISPEELEQAKIAAGRMSADPEIAALVNGARFQVHVTADYQDELTRLTVPLKCLIDVVPAAAGPYGKSIANIKTCHDGSYKKWQSAIVEHGYDMQGAMEFDMYNAAMPAEGRTFYLHPIQESKPPYAVGRRQLGADGFLHMGQEKVKKALRLYCLCLKNGVWPGFDDPFPGQTVLNHGWTIMEPTPWQLSEVM